MQVKNEVFNSDPTSLRCFRPLERSEWEAIRNTYVEYSRPQCNKGWRFVSEMAQKEVLDWESRAKDQGPEETENVLPDKKQIS